MKEFTVQAVISNVEKVTNLVNEELELNECPIKAQMQIDIAIDELFSNIAYYAYGDQTGDATIRIVIENDPKRVLLSFIDNGIPYNPLEKTDPNTGLTAEEREVGGLGIFIVKKSMDDMLYEYKDNQNILTIVKNI